MNQSPWDVLGVDESADSREIKRAYARKLKDNRPDDDPVAFQKLHEAYRHALMLEQFNRHEVAEGEPAVFVDVSDSPEDFIEVSIPVAEPQPEEPSLTAEQQQKIEEVSAEVDEALAETLSVNNPSRWSFLTDSVDLLDDAYRVELGGRVLDSILRHNAKIRAAKRFDVVQNHIIGRLDNVFFWSSNPQAFVTAENAQDAFQLLSEIDPGRREAPAKPVGGEVVHRATAERRPPRQTERVESDFNGWSIMVGVWLVAMVAKSCAQLG